MTNQAAITIGRTNYSISTRTVKQFGKEVVMYELKGVRGAHYFTMRNQANPDLMFLCDGRGFGVSSTLRNVWLTDKNGTLEVVR